MNKFVKKVATAISCCALVVGTAFAITACGKKDDPKPTTVTTYEQLAEAVTKGGQIKLGEDIELEDTIVVKKDVTLDLNGKNLTENFEWNDVEDHERDVWAMFRVLGATLTVKGQGNVTSDDLYAFSVEGKYTDGTANQNVTTASKVVVEGGNYKTDVSVIYVIGEKATCEVKGGKYDVNGSEKKYTLNFRGEYEENNPGIVVSGGEFTGFDPSKAPGEGAGFLETHPNGYLAEGYTSNEAEGTYKVEKAQA